MLLNKLDFKSFVLFAILAFCMFASSSPLVPRGIVFYAAGIVCSFLYCIQKRGSLRKGKMFVWFIVACYLTCFINQEFDYRLYIFTLIMITFTPILDSNSIREFRMTYLVFCLYAFPIISLICLYCYYAGINMMSYEDGDVSWDFSAIFPHSMWLGAAVGLSNVVCMWNIINNRKKLQYFWIAVLLPSLYLSVIAASRSALFASLIAIFLLLLTNASNVKKILKYSIMTAVAVVLLFPVLFNSADRMKAKFESSEGTYGSRTEIFEDGFEHFFEQPLFGAGFAVSYRNGIKYVGRVESGSGWLSILFQTGIVGFFIMMALLKPIKYKMIYIRKDKRFQFFFFPFVFICCHSFFEGYILTSGYYLCILFWLLLTCIVSYQSPIIQNDGIK